MINGKLHKDLLFRLASSLSRSMTLDDLELLAISKNLLEISRDFADLRGNNS